jgi:high-affinity nickel-transport protein
MRRGTYDDEEMQRQLCSRGMMNRFFGPMARRIDAPWKMYPIGFLFGLGFDTATEVLLLATAPPSTASRAGPCWPSPFSSRPA